MRTSRLNVSPKAAARAWRDAEQSDAANGVTVSCELITPMYGGGVKVGMVDKSMPIRATALRGQLRFWWRLLKGTDPAVPNLFELESSLWGGIDGSEPRASQVTVQVRGSAVGDSDLIRSDAPEIPTYALIPGPGRPPRCLKAGYRFSILLKFSPTVASERKSEVIDALRWWATFGGLGARTRRSPGKQRGYCVAARPVQRGESRRRLVGEAGGIRSGRSAGLARCDQRSAEVSPRPRSRARPRQARPWPEPVAGG